MEEIQASIRCIICEDEAPLAAIAAAAAAPEPQREPEPQSRPPPALREDCWTLGVLVVEMPTLGESLNASIRGLLAKPADR